MFRRIGKLLRAWEFYTFVRSFSPTAYLMDKAFEYMFERLTLYDYGFLAAALILALAFVVELVDGLVQVVLTVLRGIGVWHGVWPTWPGFRWLAHPTVAGVVDWFFIGVTLSLALFVWLFHFLRRLWPEGRMGQLHRSYGGASFHVQWQVFDEGEHTWAGARIRPRHKTSPTAWGFLLVGWLLQVLMWI
ncbi:hypothetical protein [Alicyclobacillus herbarius]|uniref:hypothetical protein n=1 Tax=Alicyclobacillus herbarius TaxID=122960 RepID=UPI00041A1BB9|nr:hypothetical protein [Alicyclobacillus herbarius]